MTKKDFELIASCLKDFHDSENNGDGFDLEQAFIDRLGRQNPRFDKEKFLKACGVEVEKDIWICEDCQYTCIWKNYKDGNPICPNCDIDMIEK